MNVTIEQYQTELDNVALSLNKVRKIGEVAINRASERGSELKILEKQLEEQKSINKQLTAKVEDLTLKLSFAPPPTTTPLLATTTMILPPAMPSSIPFPEVIDVTESITESQQSQESILSTENQQLRSYQHFRSFHNVHLFSVTASKWKRHSSVTDIFVSFFADQCVLGYQKESNTMMPNIRTLFQQTKRLIRRMLYFCPNYPMRNDVTTVGLQNYRKHLRQLGFASESAICRDLGLLRCNRSTIELSSIARAWDDPELLARLGLPAKELPPDTPAAMRKILN